MSNAQNLAYAAVQVFHNFGAVATVGGSLAARSVETAGFRKKLAWLVLIGWGTQAVSGAAFGLVSFLYYQKLPDIAGVAAAALAVKMVCVALGFLLVAASLLPRGNQSGDERSGVWSVSAILAFIALSAAAFLRWFS